MMTLPGAFRLLATIFLLHLASSAVLAAKVKEDFYEILGVDKKAAKASIKTAYRKLALKWHPDKHKDDKEKAEEMFRKIAQAYEVLNNDQSREQYDKFGTVGDDEENFQGEEQFDSFEDFLKANGFDFGFHDPADVFQQAISDLDVETIFKTIFDKNGKPVPADKLEENSAINDLQEAATMGVKFEFQDVFKAKDGTMKKRVLRSDGQGGVNAFTEPITEEEVMQMEMEQQQQQMGGMPMGEGMYGMEGMEGMEGMPEMMMGMDGEGMEMMDGYDPEMMGGYPEDMEGFMGEDGMFGDGQYMEGDDYANQYEDDSPPDHEEL